MMRRGLLQACSRGGGDERGGIVAQGPCGDAVPGDEEEPRRQPCIDRAGLPTAHRVLDSRKECR